MDRTSAILFGLTAVTLALGYIQGCGTAHLRWIKARLLLTRARWHAQRAARADARDSMSAAERHFERAVKSLQMALAAAETNLQADAQLEETNALLQTAAADLRQQAELAIERANALKSEAMRAVSRLEALRPDSGEFDDTGHATA